MKKTTKKQNQSKIVYPVYVEESELPNFQGMEITSAGDENLYFIHEEIEYYCKAYPTWAGEISELTKYPNMTIITAGEEFIYFIHKERYYYCKIR